MGFGFVEEAQVTAQGIMTSLRCANPDCNNIVAQSHALGSSVVRVLSCPTCGRGSEFENTTKGWTARLLPKRTPTPQKVIPGSRR